MLTGSRLLSLSLLFSLFIMLSDAIKSVSIVLGWTVQNRNRIWHEDFARFVSIVLDLCMAQSNKLLKRMHFTALDNQGLRLPQRSRYWNVDMEPAQLTTEHRSGEFDEGRAFIAAITLNELLEFRATKNLGRRRVLAAPGLTPILRQPKPSTWVPAAADRRLPLRARVWDWLWLARLAQQSEISQPAVSLTD